MHPAPPRPPPPFPQGWAPRAPRTPAPRPHSPPPDPRPSPPTRPLWGSRPPVVPRFPPAIPPVDLQEHFDPKDFSGAGVEGGRANGIVPNGSEVYAETIVEERPSLLSAPPPAYPDLLRRAGVQGRVLLRAIVDTTGRVEPSSITTMKNPDPPPVEPTRRWLLTPPSHP